MTLPLWDESSSVAYPSADQLEYDLPSANGGLMGPASIISVNTPNLEVRLGRTLSSLALPSRVDGSSCSLSMLKRADIFGMSRLVLKSSDEGRTVARSSSGFAWICFLFLLNVMPDSFGTGGPSISSAAPFVFFLARNGFIARV